MLDGSTTVYLQVALGLELESHSVLSQIRGWLYYLPSLSTCEPMLRPGCPTTLPPSPTTTSLERYILTKWSVVFSESQRQSQRQSQSQRQCQRQRQSHSHSQCHSHSQSQSVHPTFILGASPSFPLPHQLVINTRNSFNHPLTTHPSIDTSIPSHPPPAPP